MLILEVLLYSYAMWVMFLAVMALYAAWHPIPPRRPLPTFTKVLAVPAILLAVVMDIVLNLIATIPFVDLPHELTFSQRMGRYLRNPSWRTPIAKWICGNLLDPFQIGGHCNR